MAKNAKKKGNAGTKAKARKAKPHVKAKRAAKVQKKAAKRAVKANVAIAGTAAAHTALDLNEAIGDDATVERAFGPPDTDSGLDPSEEKNILDALDADEAEYDEEVGALD